MNGLSDEAKANLMADSIIDSLVMAAMLEPRSNGEIAGLLMRTPIEPPDSPRDVYLAMLLAAAINKLASR